MGQGSDLRLAVFNKAAPDFLKVHLFLTYRAFFGEMFGVIAAILRAPL